MPDFLGMMKQAAQLQSKMQAMQDELGQIEVEGSSGGGLVNVRISGKMEVKAVRIDPSLMKAEEREVLEDLLVTACNDAAISIWRCVSNSSGLRGGVPNNSVNLRLVMVRPTP